MALVSARNDFGAPPFGRVNAATTAATLHQDTDHGGIAPPGINHLPAGIIVHAAGTLTWTDASGATVATVFTAESVGIFCPIAPAAIQAAASPAITVFWHRGAAKAP